MTFPVDPARYIAFLGAMEHIAKDTLGLNVEYGQAVAAAQKVYAEQRS